MSQRFHLTILGSNSAVPAYGRFPTSQVLEVNSHLFLIDCGEGTQIRMGQYKIKRNNISHVFISHLHGDHVYGLPGLLTSMSLSGRTKALTVYGPVGIKHLIDTIFSLSMAHLSYELTIHEIHSEKLTSILELDNVSVSAFPVYHRIPCYGYLFWEKKPLRNIRKEAIREYNLNIEEIKKIKQGHSIEREGREVDIDRLTYPQSQPVSYAFCADSSADHKLLDAISNVTALYFETTYLKDLQSQADERGHATTESAAQLAKLAKVKLLITGHYSSRYRDLELFRNEIEPIFQPVIIGRDGEMINILDYA